ncbi:MAG: DinB family protein [Acidobacteriia bacterium]|nr:DinB family protein [Terriglobia bacterium]
MTHDNHSLTPLLRQALEEIESATRGMTDEQMRWHPEGKWSAVELVEHLSLAYARSAAGMRKAMSEQQAKARKATPKERVGKLLLFGFSYIPPGRKAPEAIHPKGMSVGDAMAAARRSLELVDHTISDCERHMGGMPVYTHPLLGPLTAAQWRRFHLLHTQHHMRQVRKWRKQMPQ